MGREDLDRKGNHLLRGDFHRLGLIELYPICALINVPGVAYK